MTPKFIAYEYNSRGVLSRTVFIAEDEKCEEYLDYYEANIFGITAEPGAKPKRSLEGQSIVVRTDGVIYKDIQDIYSLANKTHTIIVRLDHKFMD